MAKPDKTAVNGDRDPVTGRFLPGNVANPNGRPRALDFRRLVRERSEQEGVSVDEAMFGVYRSMLKRALAGDVQAGKLLLDRLCDTLPQKLEVEATAGAVPPDEPKTPEEWADWARRLAELASDDDSRRN